MKVELHSHTMRYSGCAVCTPAQLMKELIRKTYDAVFLTEHDAVWSDWELDNLRQDFPAIRIFPGVELSMPNEDHLLVLGTNDREYLTLRHPELILAKARQAKHLTVLAHPFRWPKTYSLLEMGSLPDALEFRTLNSDAWAGEQSKIAAQRLRLPLVNAGDTHVADTAGHFWIETYSDLVTGTEIYDIVRNGMYENAMKKILDYIEIGKKEGRLVLGGKHEGTGYFIEPTIFADVSPEARIAKEEIFGPVLAVIKAKDYNDALRIANNTEYGLTGSVYTNDAERIKQAKEDYFVGNLYFNRKCTGALVGIHPFGGFNMSGTDSKAGGPDYLLLFTQAKSIATKK